MLNIVMLYCGHCVLWINGISNQQRNIMSGSSCNCQWQVFMFVGKEPGFGKVGETDYW